MISDSRLFVLLEDFEHKVADLLEHIAQQQQRIKQLEGEIKDHKDTIRKQSIQIRQLPKKATESASPPTKSKDFSKLVSSNLPDAVAREEVKQKLDEYIRDLDRCIAHLSTLS